MSGPLEPTLPDAVYQTTDDDKDGENVPIKKTRPPVVFSFFNLFTIDLEFFADPSGKVVFSLV